MRTLETTYLYNNRDNHDKVYNVALQEHDRFRYVVMAEYGARASVLKQINKHSSSSEEAARRCYTALVNEKIAKGYMTSAVNRSKNSVIPKKTKVVEQKKAEAYNPDAIPERRLDFDDI